MRARALAGAAVDDATASRLHAGGARLRDAEVADLAFAAHDAA